MFCDGKCFKGKKKCGLLCEIIMERVGPTGQKTVEAIEKCVFHHILDSIVRQEKGQIRMQKAIESSRNEKADGDEKIAQMIAKGFLGVMQSVENKRVDISGPKRDIIDR